MILSKVHKISRRLPSTRARSPSARRLSISLLGEAFEHEQLPLLGSVSVAPDPEEGIGAVRPVPHVPQRVRAAPLLDVEPLPLTDTRAVARDGALLLVRPARPAVASLDGVPPVSSLDGESLRLPDGASVADDPGSLVGAELVVPPAPDGVDASASVRGAGGGLGGLGGGLGLGGGGLGGLGGGGLGLVGGGLGFGGGGLGLGGCGLGGAAAAGSGSRAAGRSRRRRNRRARRGGREGLAGRAARRGVSGPSRALAFLFGAATRASGCAAARSFTIASPRFASRPRARPHAASRHRARRARAPSRRWRRPGRRSWPAKRSPARSTRWRPREPSRGWSEGC